MDENGAQESHVDFHVLFDTLEAQKEKYLKSNHWFSMARQSPAGQASPIW